MKRIIVIEKTIIVACITAALMSGCAKRYDTATKIKSETTITQDSAAPIAFEAPMVPMAGQVMKQTVGGGQIAQNNDTVGRSLNGKKLIEVKFVKQDGQFSVLEVLETGERFKAKGHWATAEGEQFKIER